MNIAKAIVFISISALMACESDNEHFCSRYEYVYDQLNDPELPSYNDMKQQLQKEIDERPGDNDQQKFMLFVLEDFNIEIKPQHLKPREFCMQSQRWKYY